MDRQFLWGWQPSDEQREHIEQHIEDSFQLFIANKEDLADKGMAVVTKYECCGGPVWIATFEDNNGIRQFVHNNLHDAQLEKLGEDIT